MLSQTNDCETLERSRAAGSSAPHCVSVYWDAFATHTIFFVNTENLAQFMATSYNTSPGEAETPGAGVRV